MAAARTATANRIMRTILRDRNTDVTLPGGFPARIDRRPAEQRDARAKRRPVHRVLRLVLHHSRDKRLDRIDGDIALRDHVLGLALRDVVRHLVARGEDGSLRSRKFLADSPEASRRKLI